MIRPLPPAPVIGLLLWLGALTVLAVWPVLGEAPWQSRADRSGSAAGSDARRLLMCRDALERRQGALRSLAAPRREGDREYTAGRRQASYSPTIPPWTEAERQLKAAQEDIDRLC